MHCPFLCVRAKFVISWNQLRVSEDHCAQPWYMRQKSDISIGGDVNKRSSEKGETRNIIPLCMCQYIQYPDSVSVSHHLGSTTKAVEKNKLQVVGDLVGFAHDISVIAS